MSALRKDDAVRERVRQIFDATSGEMSNRPEGRITDIYARFAELRESGPVHRGSVAQNFGIDIAHGAVTVDGPNGPPEIFSCYSFETCDRAYRDSETFSSDVFTGRFSALVGNSILNMGGAEHRRYRALAQPRFVPRAMPWWQEGWITKTVDSLISQFADDGRAELTLALCAQLPLLTIAGSFGLDPEAALDVREIISHMMFGVGFTLDERLAFRDRFDAHLLEVIASRRVQPRDDLISALVQSEVVDDDGRHLLTDDEIIGNARLLLVAGSGTTWRQLGITLYALLTHPDVLAELRADRSLMPAVIEETLRWETTDPYFPRLVKKDTELGGAQLPAGSVIEMCIGAGNRDPERWPDPERWDPHRTRAPHLAFATGPHTCLGAHVARTEMSVAINALLDRLPDLRLDPAAPVPHLVGLEHRGPTALSVVFG
jgi:cytochrome P450